jgi:3-phenylpropionate/trans-cinnamate dioxygenase ferredoxin subunit
MPNDMQGFQYACPVESVPEGGMRTVELSDRMVILVRFGGRLYCLDDVCTHDGGTLSDGTFCDGRVACPRHGAEFDVRTGQALTMPATEDTVVHEVKEDQGKIYVRIQQE